MTYHLELSDSDINLIQEALRVLGAHRPATMQAQDEIIELGGRINDAQLSIQRRLPLHRKQ